MTAAKALGPMKRAPERPDVHRAPRRGHGFWKSGAQLGTGLNERTVDRRRGAWQARESRRQWIRSLLLEPVTDWHRADNDLVRTELLLKMRAKVTHHCAPLERRS